jgi:hypothetical protein
MKSQNTLRKRSHYLLCIAAALLFGLSDVRAASEGVKPETVVGPDAKSRIKAGAKIAVALTGNEAVLTDLLEDVLRIQLTQAGFEVFSREQLEAALAKRLSSKPEQAADSAIGTIEVARSLGADLVVTGSAIMLLSETQPVLVKAASFQVLDGGSGKLLVQAFFEALGGLRVSEVGRGFIDVLNVDKK